LQEFSVTFNTQRQQPFAGQYIACLILDRLRILQHFADNLYCFFLDQLRTFAPEAGSQLHSAKPFADGDRYWLSIYAVKMCVNPQILIIKDDPHNFHCDI
jgi:hypothetical protein